MTSNAFLNLGLASLKRERERERERGEFPGGPVVKAELPLQGTWVQFLVSELRSHMLCGMAKRKKEF